MKLNYRGVSYEANPPTPELMEGEIGSKYRGVNFKPHYPRHIPVTQPVIGLTYRGVDHCTGDPIDVEASLLRRCYANEAISTDEAIPTVSSRQQALDELTTTHVVNIRQNLEHRLQVARAKGDQNLIRLLEAEAKQLA